MRRCTAERISVGAASFLAALLFFVAPLFATEEQDHPVSDQIEGVLRDAEFGYPIPDVEIHLQVAGQQQVEMTGIDGSFRFFDLPPGSIQLLVYHQDYETISIVIRPEERQEPLELKLGFARGDESARTTARRPRAPTATAESFERRDIEAAPHRNAEEILRQVPGLTLTQHGSEGKGHQFFLRGFDAIHGSDLEITLEGIPLNEWSNPHGQGYIDLGIIIPEMVNSLNVIKGPFTLEQGLFATSGSADYQMGFANPKERWQAAYTAGSTNRHRLFAAYTGEERQFLALEGTYDQGFGENRGIRRGTINARTPLLISAAHRLDLFGAASVADFELPGILRFREYREGQMGFYDVHEHAGAGQALRALGALFYDGRFGSHALSARAFFGYRDLDLLENYTGFIEHPVHSDRRRQLYENFNGGLFADLRSPLKQSLDLELGLGARADFFARSTDHLGLELEKIAREEEEAGSQTHFFSHGGLRWRPHGAIELAGGARVDGAHFSLKHGNYGPAFLISPRLSARWQALESLIFFTALGRGLRPADAATAPSFIPAESAELGTIYLPTDWLELRLAGFGTYISQESVFDHATNTTINHSATRRIGLEFDGRIYPADWLMIRGDLTFADGRFLDSGAYIPTAPWLVGAAHLLTDHRIKDGVLHTGLRLRAMAPRRLPHGAKGATFALIDLSASYRWQVFELSLEIENLLNQRANEGEYHFASHWAPGEPASAIPSLHFTPAPPLNARLTLGAFF